MSVIEDLLSLVAPHYCVGCQSEGALLCDFCANTLQKIPERCYSCGRWSENFKTCVSCRRSTPLYSVLAATRYEAMAKELVHTLKFGRARAAAKTIAKVLSDTVAPSDALLITYVPTVAKRVRERGYDQAALIARALSRQLGVPYLPLLARVGEQRQVGQTRQTRIKQMATAFRPLHNLNLSKKHVLLVDDVLTTGSTCEAAARVLRQAGAKRVSAAVFAVA